PVTPQTPFRIASLSKQITAIAARQLIDEGLLRLDATVRDYLPWFGADGSAVASITVRDLLAHTSGWTTRDGTVTLTEESTDALAIERNVRRLAGTEPTLGVGTFEYTNATYDVLGYLVATVSGTTFEDYVTEHVLDPLEMSHTYLDVASAKADGLAEGHYRFFGVLASFDPPFSASDLPSAMMMSSAEDLGHLLSAHLADGRYGDGRVLSETSMADIQRPLVEPGLGSGYGWGLWTYPLYEAGGMDADAGTFAAPLVHEHTGSNSSFASGTILLPQAGYGVVVLLNLNDEVAPSRFYQLHMGIAMILSGGEAAALTSYDDPLRVYGKAIVLAVLGLQLIGVLIATLRLRRWMRHPPDGSATTGWRLRNLVLPLAFDLGAPIALWALYLDAADLQIIDIPRAIRLAPDLTLGLIVLAVIGLAWGMARTWLTWRLIRPVGADPVAA
ncbi:MAG TPA: serine hydrolase domain-containing protein, partial [Candidatus Limnocylindria bacterium]|nr:serine hydrolase domain-containing protein [Candidatus Limnocylindria bacterium]